MGRSAILKRIRQAVEDADPPAMPSELPRFPAFPDPVAQFRKELEAVDGHFYDGRRKSRLPGILSRILAQCCTEEIFWEAAAMFERHGIQAQPAPPGTFDAGRLAFSRHAGQRVEFPIRIDSRTGGRQELASIRLSASSAACGIAETGTVVQQVEAGTGRLFAVLPPCHLVFLSRPNLLMNQSEFFGRGRLGEQGSATTLVTGPSRTADIEKQLVVGVHGPKQWFVVLTE
ncbi:MAG: LUD domain-containing protein [Acidobacteriota bacterium]